MVIFLPGSSTFRQYLTLPLASQEVAGPFDNTLPFPFSFQECLVGRVWESKSGQLWVGKALADSGREGATMVSSRMQRTQQRVDTQVKSTKL